ncbi:acyl-coenzyme A thioesterase PaaI [Clostridium homopropionicum DSM 5847]|uniref:Acyl-coenzyme A thioesterase PaaI n=1 Tax=Clostridium homopropionicum DSM 5847 TaxID=1121318 RepID=A0A0L6ZEN8_9CLOT|nr:PaaI family thioesterase [Clostridium homopropionicum]KOA21441.1 acyl-coenzyme A thioesterase PaaI [Clostridium homopropionicum DSM 5847]SFG09744.1 acyl-CoA thioesterase [Clostridium homopropionicum]
MNTDMLKFVENDRFAKFIGIKLIEVRPAYAIAQMEITENHLNGLNLVQGGAIFTLADYAFAAASNSKGFATVSINTNISFLKSPIGKILTAEAKEISSSKSICIYNIDVFDEDNTLIATLSSTGFIKR